MFHRLENAKSKQAYYVNKVLVASVTSKPSSDKGFLDAEIMFAGHGIHLDNLVQRDFEHFVSTLPGLTDS